jgi:hypothetical protein
MAGKRNFGDFANPNDPMLAKAYCEGRKASIAGAAIGTNPHPANSPANLAWARGHASYESTGTVTGRDCCAEPWKLQARSFVLTVLDLGVTLATTPAMKVTIDWGDGTVAEDADGDVAHTYADEGEYTVRIYFQGKMMHEEVIVLVAP